MQQLLFMGCVESRADPLRLGRVQARIVGLHTEDKSVLPTDKLPWAIPIQPVTSAAISGIGDSPLGFVEGSMVVIIFADPDQQQPLILGGIGGIPQDRGNIDYSSETLTLKNSDGDVVRNPVDEESTSEETNLKPAMAYNSISDRLLSFLKREEGLRLNAYQDSGGAWAVGYGTTLIDGKPVTPNLSITEGQAEEYLKASITNDAMDSVRKNTKALLTPSMFDSLVSFTYNVGRGNYFKSNLRTELNAGKYLDCCSKFEDYIYDTEGKLLSGLVNRRKREKVLFLEDGIPGESGDIKNNPEPVDEVTEQGNVSSGIKVDDLGFQDPKGMYPLYKNEPDTNRLARHESISKTIVAKKEAARERNIPTGGGSTWNQSPIPYNAQYPFNHVYQTESGHVMEFDDTKNSERIHIYHRTGTFTEIDANGTQVNRIVGDGYEILERNGYIHINGTANVTIDGANNVRVGGALNLDVIGNTTINVYNDVDLNVSGDMNVAVSGDYKLKADSIVFSTTSTLDFSSAETIIQTGSLGVNSGSFTTTCDINLGGVGASNPVGIPTPGGIQVPEEVSFSSLEVITRGAEAALQYETPEDGDPSDYITYQIDKGLILEEDVNSGTEKESSTLPKNAVKPVDSSCDVIFGMSEFPASLQLSRNFTLGVLTNNGSRKLVDQFGTSKQQIACNLKQLCVNALEPIYEKYPNMIITSGFRRPGDVANSSPTSDHYLGYAADIRLNGYNREQHYRAIKEIQKIIPYSQLILEYSGSSTVWIHVSYKSSGNKNKHFTMRDHRRVSEFGQFKLIV